jgi:hypothetical protein
MLLWNGKLRAIALQLDAIAAARKRMASDVAQGKQAQG